MAQDNNLFALLADEEGDEVMKLIARVKEEEKKNSSLVKKVQKEKKEEKNMADLVPTDTRAKRLILPTHVRGSFVVFDKKKEREKAEEEAKAKDSMESNGDQEKDFVPLAANDKTGEQLVNGNFSALDNSNAGQSTNSNGYPTKHRAHYNVQRSGYQQSNGYNGDKYRGANGYQPNNGGHYQGSYIRSNGNHQHYNSKNGVSNCDQLNNSGDSNGNAADDGWQYVGHRRHGKGRGAYLKYFTPEKDGSTHGSLKESNNSEKDSAKSVNGDENGEMTENENLPGEQAVENEVQGHLHVTTEGQEDAQSEKKSFDKEEGKSCVSTVGQEDAQSEKKSNEGDDNVEKKEIMEKQKETEQNFMTLKEFEKKKCEDRKSLEAFKKPEQRKVEDKDFESMQLIGKKKEESQQPKKKKDNMEQKFPKTLTINNESLKLPSWWTPYKHTQNGDRPYGRQYVKTSNGKINRDSHNGKLDGAGPNEVFAGERPKSQHDSERPATAAATPAPAPPTFDIEQHQFPALR